MLLDMDPIHLNEPIQIAYQLSYWPHKGKTHDSVSLADRTHTLRMKPNKKREHKVLVHVKKGDLADNGSQMLVKC